MPKAAETPTALLHPVRIEVGNGGPRGPSFRWIDGYQVGTPDGLLHFPYMRRSEARSYCRVHGWRFREANATETQAFLKASA